MHDATAILFPGQGSHHGGMDEPFAAAPALRRGIGLLGYDPFARLTDGTGHQQPAIFLCSMAAWEQRRDELEPVAAAGHSLGEYAALTAAGALQFEDALRLVAERAAAMADAAARRPGGMTAMLGGDPQAVRALADDHGLVVANDNAPGQLVLAGPLTELDRAEAAARERTGARPRRLDVAGAFHSPLMAPAAERLAEALQRTPVADPRFPVYSNATAAPFSDIRRELAENLLAPVRWRATLLALRAAGAESFHEIGPGDALRGMVRRTLEAA